MRIALFVTCLVDGLFPDVGRATVSLLRRLGHEVEFPLAQTCCGQMHINTGYPRQALPLVANHVAAFAGYDAVVAPSRLVHRLDPPPARRPGPPSPATPALAAARRRSWRAAPTSCRSSWSTCSG